jgi:glycosyltransferase involved in cell wall biosynthesis
MADLLEAAACGIVVPPSDPAALARAIERLADAPDVAKQMGMRGHQWAPREHDFPALVHRWVAALEAPRGSDGAG